MSKMAQLRQRCTRAGRKMARLCQHNLQVSKMAQLRQRCMRQAAKGTAMSTQSASEQYGTATLHEAGSKMVRLRQCWF